MPEPYDAARLWGSGSTSYGLGPKVHLWELTQLNGGYARRSLCGLVVDSWRVGPPERVSTCGRCVIERAIRERKEADRV